VIDDYQSAALVVADWSAIAEDVDVRSISRHIDSANELVAAKGSSEPV
jgi:hypothetical protein